MSDLKPCIVVSGHPRSGTSMMMKMLYDGGLDIVADEESLKSKRHAEYGTFEILNYGWLIDNYQKIAGHAVKIVTQYTHVLEGLKIETPLPLKVIFMLRSISAIHASLKAMDTIWDPPPHESIALTKRVIEHHNIPTIFVEYDQVLEYPVAQSLRVKDFVEPDMDTELDIVKMVSAVDPTQCHYK